MEKTEGFRGKHLKVFIAFSFICLLMPGLFSDDLGWKIEKSAHFIIYYQNSSKDFLDKLEDRAEDAYRGIADELGFFRDQPWLWDKRASIYVFDSKQEYLAYTGMPEWSGGSARPYEKKVFTYAESYKFFESTLVHELTHLIFHEFIGKDSLVPLWIDEGAAVYMERLKKSGFLKGGIEAMVKEGKVIPFKEILRVSSKDLDIDSNRENPVSKAYVDRFYTQSWSMVYFLIKKYDLYRFKQFAREMRRGMDFEKSFYRIYSGLKNPEEWEKQWEEFYR